MSEAFDRAYRAWRDRVDGDARLRNSSATQAFTDLPEYRAIVALGPGVLPEVMDKIAGGEFLLNTAAFELAAARYEDVLPDPAGFYAEQEVSEFLLQWWRSRPPP